MKRKMEQLLVTSDNEYLTADIGLFGNSGIDLEDELVAIENDATSAVPTLQITSKSVSARVVSENFHFLDAEIDDFHFDLSCSLDSIDNSEKNNSKHYLVDALFPVNEEICKFHHLDTHLIAEIISLNANCTSEALVIEQVQKMPNQGLYFSLSTPVYLAKTAIYALPSDRWLYLNTNNIHLNDFVMQHPLPLKIGLVIGNNIEKSTALAFASRLSGPSQIKFEGYNVYTNSLIADIVHNLQKHVTLVIGHDTSIKFVINASTHMAAEAILSCSHITPDATIRFAMINQNQCGYITFHQAMRIEKVGFLAQKLKPGRHLLLTANIPEESLIAAVKNMGKGTILVLDANFTSEKWATIAPFLGEDILLKHISPSGATLLGQPGNNVSFTIPTALNPVVLNYFSSITYPMSVHPGYTPSNYNLQVMCNPARFQVNLSQMHPTSSAYQSPQAIYSQSMFYYTNSSSPYFVNAMYNLPVSNIYNTEHEYVSSSSASYSQPTIYNASTPIEPQNGRGGYSINHAQGFFAAQQLGYANRPLFPAIVSAPNLSHLENNRPQGSFSIANRHALFPVQVNQISRRNQKKPTAIMEIPCISLIGN